MIFLVVLLGWHAIGAYVTWAAVGNEYLHKLKPEEWALATLAWPWTLVHCKKIRKERSRLRPFEDYMERYEQEQIDRRLGDLKDD